MAVALKPAYLLPMPATFDPTIDTLFEKATPAGQEMQLLVLVERVQGGHLASVRWVPTDVSTLRIFDSAAGRERPLYCATSTAGPSAAVRDALQLMVAGFGPGSTDEGSGDTSGSTSGP